MWRERISAWTASGLTARAFCGDHSLSEPSFYAWRRTLRERDGAAESGRGRKARSKRSSRRVSTSVSADAARAPRFIPVTVVDSPPDPAPPAGPEQCSIEITHASGATVRINAAPDPELLAAVFAALERASSC